ncbi:MAG TPA: L,D-transpeptidase family protein [Conexibacter sp.]|nr:L,D-transpeptidase family protein [Conexibacter sp.]
MLRRLSLLAALPVVLAPAVASAAATKPHGKPKATGRIGLQVAGAYALGARQLAVTGRELKIEGRIVPYVPGQRVSVRIWRGHKLIKRVTVTPKPTHTKKTAVFSARFTPEKSGDVQVFAVHEQTDDQRALSTRAPLFVVTPAAGPGTRSPFVSLIQQRLAALGYATPQSGVYDELTGLAVLAFRKVNGMERITTLSPDVVDRVLRGVGGFKIRYPQHGRHVEANLGWQVLALIENGKVVRAYVTSSGKPSTPTVLGSFHFYSKTIGTNALGMVDSNYFIRGYAIHGYHDVPAYNASHGCLRVPIPDARAIYDWVHLGDGIDVYY